MDKIVGELLGPFASRLATSAAVSTLTYWLVGVVLFFWLHPQPLPGCPSGGKDLCGALTGGWARAVPLIACVVVAMVVSHCLWFGEAMAVTSLLTGTHWPRPARFAGAWLESKRRKRIKRRALETPPVRRAQAELHRFPHNGRLRGREVPPQEDLPLEPTRLGNVFAAAAEHVRDERGLELQSCWPHLKSVATSTEMTNLEFASRVLLTRAQALMWLLASLGWLPLLPGTPPKLAFAALALALARVFYGRMCQAAAHYCDSLETVVHTHEAVLLKRAGRSASLPSQRSLRLRRPGGATA
ncbi:hypothetical protein [Lentzea sp. NPDC003310]|uniref:hypothetical protein n=1 Tax=Lentzea sp. NPDC003310 TaxID=3154447 RepID=UPI0033BD01EB